MPSEHDKKIEDDSSSKKNVVSLRFQVIFIFFSIMSLFFIYKQRLNKFVSVDGVAELKDYNPESLNEFGDFHSKILTGLIIERYEVFDMINNKFVLFGVVWFLVDPTIVDITTLGQFSFEQGKLLYVSRPATYIVENKLLVQYRIQLQYSGKLVYTYFPLDEHSIELKLTNTVLTPQESIFVSEYRYFTIEASAKPFGWQALDKHVLYGYRGSFLDNFQQKKQNLDPFVKFVIDFKRISYRYIISLLFPMLTFFYLSLFSFSIIGSSRFYLPTVALTALISFRFIIDRESPTVGYFMLSDYLFFIFLSAIFTVFLFLLSDEISGKIISFNRKVFLIVLHAIVIIFNIYFVL